MSLWVRDPVPTGLKNGSRTHSLSFISTSRFPLICLHLSFCVVKSILVCIHSGLRLVSVRKVIRRGISESSLSDGCQVLSPSSRCDRVPKAVWLVDIIDCLCLPHLLLFLCLSLFLLLHCLLFLTVLRATCIVSSFA